MNIINVAKFFDCMARGDIAFSVDDVMTDFETHFGVKMHCRHVQNIMKQRNIAKEHI